ncbi:MAG: C/D box methylation guide ribonucleoprotein complex aNOP56 subunit [Promethearchaeota archaeon]|nr:MAG: C/D box methylation guide ribonucleoprotein complex aNOP56 subunit [Candidatus Lokiarchaeota archaeon]
MKCYIIDTLIGLFAQDNQGNLLNFRNFNDQTESAINFFTKLDQGELLEEYINLLDELTNSGFDTFIFDNENLETMTSEKLSLNTKLEPSSLEFKNFRSNLLEKLKTIGLNYTEQEIKKRYKKINQELIRQKVREAGEEKDIFIVQVIEILDSLKETISQFSSRLREWYGLHFPELTDRIIEDNILLAEIVAKVGNRKNYNEEVFKNRFEIPQRLIEKLINMSTKSMGADINLKMVKDFAQQILSINNYRISLESHLEDLMSITAPNIQAIVGSLIGAKLIAKAGNLRKLAFMPASRIQLLGAETALYRHLKSGQKLPKHGIIFQWQQIRGNPPWIRGNIARLIAGKLGLAAKIDYFSGDFVGGEYAKEIEEKIEEIKKKYPTPPERKPKKKRK